MTISRGIVRPRLWDCAGGVVPVKVITSKFSRRCREQRCGEDKAGRGKTVENARARSCNVANNASGVYNGNKSQQQAAMKLSCVMMLLALVQIAQGQDGNIKTVLGGSIDWHLEDDFEVSRNVTFRLVTYWSKEEIAYEGTGIDIVIGKPVQMPSEGLSYASRFGNLKVLMGPHTFLFPNKYVVMSFEDNVIEGWFTQTFKVPNDVYNGNASLSGSSGGPLSRAGIYTQGGAVQKVEVNGGLVQCQMAGPSPTPCEVYTSHIRGKMGPNPIELSYFTTFSLPRPGLSPSSEFYRGKVRNRNSAKISARPIYWITDIWPGRTNSFMVPAYDRDGDLVKTFVGGSRQGSSGSDHILCETGNMTSFGCFGPLNDVDGPPYESVNFIFGLQDKVATDSLNFFYSFTMNITDGERYYSLSDVIINYCNPLIKIGQGTILDRPAEFFDYDSSGNIVRRRPRSFMECALEGPCVVTLYAGRFNDNVVTTPSRHQDQQGNLKIQLAGSGIAGYLGNQTTLANGVAFRNFTFGKLPHGHFDEEDIGSHRVACFTITGHTECKTPPLCVTIKVRGTKPRFLAPTPPMTMDTDDVRFDKVTPTPVCAGFSVSFEIRATDANDNELVTLDVYDNTGDGDNIFAEPYNAKKVGNFTGTTEIAQATIIYELDYAKGVKRDPVTRSVAFARDRRICTVAVDNTLAYHYAFGDLSDNELYRGNFITRPKCHEIIFSGPPAFLTSPSRFDGSPFLAFDGTIEERMRTIDAFIGVEKSITFRAKDPNWDGRVTILIMEDPGIPNGAVIGPSTCEPQFLITTWNASGLWSECGVASRTIKWTPHPAVFYKRNYRICAIARDSTPIPECPNPKMTEEGWYGEEHCTEIQVIPPQLRWTVNSELGPIPNSTRNVFVPCETLFMLEAEETGSGFNNTGVRVLTPYQPVIILKGNGHSARVSLTSVSQGRTSSSVLSFKASRGDEGRVETICFTVRDDQSVLELPPSCVTVTVKRCVYCVNPGDTLERIMQEIAMDFNWLRLWAANGNDDGDNDTTTVLHPDDLKSSTKKQIINIGSIYTVEIGDSLADLAVKFQTTVKLILSLNPDVAPASDAEVHSYTLQEGQPLCIVPCAVLPELPRIS